MWKMISPANFLIFQNFNFWGFYGGKRAKDDLKLPVSARFALYSGTVDHIMKILIMISTVAFLYYYLKNTEL